MRHGLQLAGIILLWLVGRNIGLSRIAVHCVLTWPIGIFTVFHWQSPCTALTTGICQPLGMCRGTVEESNNQRPIWWRYAVLCESTVNSLQARRRIISVICYHGKGSMFLNMTLDSKTVPMLGPASRHAITLPWGTWKRLSVAFVKWLEFPSFTCAHNALHYTQNTEDF